MKFKRLSLTGILLILLGALLAPVLSTGAFALSGSDPLVYAGLSGAAYEFDFSPNANSDYAVFILSADSGAVQAHAELLESGEVIASGDGTGAVLSEWLVAGTKYTVRVTGSGNAVIEIARSALSRSFAQPLEIEDGGSHGKMIARSGDAHWYRFTAGTSAPLLICGMPEDANLTLSALLFDERGVLLSSFETLSGGACMLRAETEAGRSYYVRVFSPDGGEGYYTLGLNRAAGNVPPPAFSAATYTLSEGSALKLAAETHGQAAIWISSNPEVAAVLPDGTLLGRKPGDARITAYGLSGSAECAVSVRHVPIEGLSILGETIRLSVGDDTALQLEFSPADASDQRVFFASADPSVASVTPEGVVTALAEGQTTLIATSLSGGFQALTTVEVSPAVRKYRALLVSEQNYPASVNTVRSGSENSVNALDSLLGTAKFESAAYVTRVRSDLSKAELIFELRDAFTGAAEQDISLVYITSHGYYANGMSFLELTDGSVLSARDLERELRRIPGTVVVMLDCCGSGGILGAGSDNLAFARGITGAFAGASVSGSKYKVITSAALDQDSYRIAFNENADSGVMATVFMRALADAAGWDIDRSARGTLSADLDYNRQVTLAELEVYLSQRVDWYLSLASGLTGKLYRQSVQVYPQADPFIWIER